MTSIFIKCHPKRLQSNFNCNIYHYLKHLKEEFNGLVHGLQFRMLLYGVLFLKTTWKSLRIWSLKLD